MASRPQILASAQAQFPKSANKQVGVRAAWRREDSTLDHPEPNGTDGWTYVNGYATYEFIKKLKDQGYTVVNLETGGTSWPFKDVAISQLI
jgi:hypothetical protein